MIILKFQLMSYRMVHDLVPYEMIQEEYQDGWIRAAAARGVTDGIIHQLMALLTE